jgi:hypothetical protein
VFGVKLYATPWDDEHLNPMTLDELRQAHLAQGLPESLVNVLHLAGEADVRFLIFHWDAPRFDGLPIYDRD